MQLCVSIISLLKSNNVSILNFNALGESKVMNNERGSERRKSERRRVRTSKVFVRMIRTSKDQNIENLKRIRTSKVKLDFRRSDFTYGVKKNQNVENQKEQLPMAYCLCVPRSVGGQVRVN